MNISPCVLSEPPVRKNLFASDESRTSLHVSITSREATLASMTIQYAEFFSRGREVYTASKVSASRNDSLQFMHSAMCLLDRNVSVGAHAGIGIRDGNSSEA